MPGMFSQSADRISLLSMHNQIWAEVLKKHPSPAFDQKVVYVLQA